MAFFYFWNPDRMTILALLFSNFIYEINKKSKINSKIIRLYNRDKQNSLLFPFRNQNTQQQKQTSKCVLRADLSLKRKPHFSHSNGLSSVCVQKLSILIVDEKQPLERLLVFRSPQHYTLVLCRSGYCRQLRSNEREMLTLRMSLIKQSIFESITLFRRSFCRNLENCSIQTCNFHRVTLLQYKTVE